MKMCAKIKKKTTKKTTKNKTKQKIKKRLRAGMDLFVNILLFKYRSLEPGLETC